MDCPRCNQTLKRIDRSVPGRQDSKRIFYCEHCGWGKEQLEKKESSRSPGPRAAPDAGPATWLKLGGLWALSAAIVIVPYVLIIQIPSLFGSAYPELFDTGEATARMVETLNPTYWVIVAIYTGICASFQTPNINWKDMGWFGGLVNNPFSYSDNINRQKYWLLMLMLPGKIIVVTATATYRLIRTLL